MPMQQTAEGRRGVPDPRQFGRVWNEKPTLRLLYTDYHRRLIETCPDGPLLDIDGSTAHVIQVRSDVRSTDILPRSSKCARRSLSKWTTLISWLNSSALALAAHLEQAGYEMHELANEGPPRTLPDDRLFANLQTRSYIDVLFLRI
jgi:hypothetical protein